MVESAQPFDCTRAVASRYRIKRCIELDLQIEPASDTAKSDDLDACRKSSHELGALQRLGLLRQRGQAAIDAAFPIGRRPRDPSRLRCHAPVPLPTQLDRPQPQALWRCPREFGGTPRSSGRVPQQPTPTLLAQPFPRRLRKLEGSRSRLGPRRPCTSQRSLRSDLRCPRRSDFDHKRAGRTRERGEAGPIVGHGWA